MSERDDVVLTDEQWAAVEPYLPRSTARTGRPQADLRRVFEAILFVLVTGCQWRRLPRERYGPHPTAFAYFNRWRRDGTLARLAAALRREADRRALIEWSLLLADGTSVRAGACAGGGTRGSPRRASRRTTPSAAPGAGTAASCTC
jgi:transposase